MRQLFKKNFSMLTFLILFLISFVFNVLAIFDFYTARWPDFTCILADYRYVMMMMMMRQHESTGYWWWAKAKTVQ